jgi:geranylgeranyl pyrophosphate synthase
MYFRTGHYRMNLPSETLEYMATLAGPIARRIEDEICSVRNAHLRRSLEDGVEGGKRIRPMLTCLACAAVGGSVHDAIDAGVAFELLHVSSCVHDDIMDQSPLRRGRGAVHVVHGQSMAILAGDALVAMAFRLMHGLRSRNLREILSRFSSAFSDLCEGQADDLTMHASDAATLHDHRRMVENKTARLVEAAAAIGALIGNGSRSHVEDLACFGLNVGLAYQAQDDLLDHVGSEEFLGKPVGNDRKNGKHTYLTEPAAVPDVVGTVSKIVREHTQAAICTLEGLPETPARECLRGLALSLADRRH